MVINNFRGILLQLYSIKFFKDHCSFFYNKGIKEKRIEKGFSNISEAVGYKHKQSQFRVVQNDKPLKKQN